MKQKTTNRGFNILNFKDYNNNNFSIQKSSLATDDCIWLGIDKPKLTIFENENKGKYIITDISENWMVNNRIHLTKEQVK